MTYTIGSLFAGVGGFDLGFERAGFMTRWQVEIDPAASGVLAHHWPDVPRYADVCEVDGAAIEPVDVITFGSPCQDLSVAGQRRGLAGAHSGLYFEAIRIIREMRDATNGRRPAFALWENVPGAHSSLFGRDYGAALDALAECGALDIAWRILDSQYFGLAQRRRRVFTLADFGGERAGEILALADSLRGHPPPRRTAGQAIAGTLGRVASGGGGHRLDLDSAGAYIVEGHGRGIANGLTARYANGPDSDATDTLILVGAEGVRDTLRADGFDASEDGTGRGTPIVACRWWQGAGTDEDRSPSGTVSDGHVPAVAFTNRGHDSGDVGETLRAASHGAIPMAVAFAERTRDGGRTLETQNELAYAVTNPGAGGTSHSLRVAIHTTGYQGDRVNESDGTWTTLSAQNANNGGGAGAKLLHQMTVRRLMPVECERLQGFPEIANSCTIEVWNRDSGDRPKNLVHVATPSLRSLRPVGSAGSAESNDHAPSADSRPWPVNPRTNRPVVLSVHIDLERHALELRSPERLLWSVRGADEKSWFLPHTHRVDFAHLAAAISQTLARTTTHGRAESPTSNGRSSPQPSGSIIVPVSGREIDERAGAAADAIQKATALTKSTISVRGESSPNYASILTTLCCSVAHAIRGYIPEPTRNADFYDFALTITNGWTALRADGTAQADGPRYRQMGNAVSVNVSYWIAKRIMEIWTQDGHAPNGDSTKLQSSGNATYPHQRRS